MRVLLIYPRTVERRVPEPGWLPLGLSYLAAVLERNGHTVSIFDRYAHQARVGTARDRVDAAMLQHVQSFKPDLIGLNTVAPLIYDTVQTVSLLRDSFDGPIVAGGHHATALPELTLQKIPGLDGVIEGEGEAALAALAGGSDRAGIPGLWWRTPERIIHTPPQQIKDLDELPFPALGLLDMAFYTRPNAQVIRGHFLSTVSLLTSRGCTRRCEFCTESLTYGRGVRFHSAAYVVELVEKVLGDYNVNGIYFHDNDFMINESRVVGICERMLTRGLHRQIKWAIQARADRIKPQVLSLLKRAGCVLIEIGIESHSQAELDRVNKGTTVDLNEQVIAACRKQGISVHAYMLTGLKGETIFDLEQKMRWLKRINPDTFSWSPLMVHPGTRLYQREGIRFFEENEWSEQNLLDYYGKTDLSSISTSDRSVWMRRYYGPYVRRKNRLHTLRVNSPVRVVVLVGSKLKRGLGAKRSLALGTDEKQVKGMNDK